MDRLGFIYLPVGGCHVKTCTGLTRYDLIAMAVMLGCDYMPQGVPGVGKEMALRAAKEERDFLRIFQQGETELSGKCHGSMFRVPELLYFVLNYLLCRARTLFFLGLSATYWKEVFLSLCVSLQDLIDY